LVSKQQRSKTRRWSFWLRFFVAAAAIALILRLGNWKWDEIGDILSRLNPLAIVGAVGLFILGNTLVAVRWFLLLRTQTDEISFPVCLKIHFLGLFYTNLMLSSVTGDLFRMWYITHHTKRRLESVFSVVVDRMVGVLSLIVLVTIVYRLIPLKESSEGLTISANLNMGTWLAEHWIVPAVFGGILVALSLFVILIPGLRQGVAKRIVPIVSHIRRLLHALAIYSSRPGILLLALVITLIAQTLPIFGYWLIGQSAQINAPLKYYFLFFPIGWAISTLPINIGVVEGGLVYLFTRISTVTFQQALVLAVCQRVIGLMGSIPGVFVHLSGLHLPKEVSLEKDFLVDGANPDGYSE
jgi:glycosyltransferase 2 family protein